MEHFNLLHNLTVRNTDNGVCFLDTTRLDRIAYEDYIQVVYEAIWVTSNK